MFINQVVQTPYGLGKILEKRKTDLVVEPVYWSLANKQKPVFYLNPADAKKYFDIDDVVHCSYGKGKILKIREDDGIHEVELSEWKLANSKSPVVYVNCSSLWKEDKVKEEPPKSDFFERQMEKSSFLKNKATESFKESNLTVAMQLYAEALREMQLLNDNLENEQKAKVFEQSVICNNNIALCALRLKKYQDCTVFARSAIILIESLEKRIPESLVWKCLQDLGVTETKLQKEWKKKSYYYMGKAELKRNNYQEAIKCLEYALHLIKDDESLKSNVNELKDLINGATKKRNEEKKKEKSTWSKAFQKNNEESKVDNSNAKPVTAKTVNLNVNGKPIDVNIDMADLTVGKKPKANSKGADFDQLSNNTLGFSLIGLGLLGLVGGLTYFFTRGKRN